MGLKPPFGLAAKRVRDFENVPETVRKRAKLAAQTVGKYEHDSDENDDDGDGNFEWSAGPDDVDKETQTFLKKLEREVVHCLRRWLVCGSLRPMSRHPLRQWHCRQ